MRRRGAGRGPNLLATILFEKYGAHQPLNRQRDRYAREGVDLSLSTLADQVGACAVALRPLHDLIEAHVMAAERLHGDDTPGAGAGQGKCATGRAWVYVRDDRPFRRCGSAGGSVPLLARPLRRLPDDIDWVLRVDGHTDRLPISTPAFPSNWELSTARAIAVVKYLIERGVPATDACGGRNQHDVNTRPDQFRRVQSARAPVGKARKVGSSLRNRTAVALNPDDTNARFGEPTAERNLSVKGSSVLR